VQELPSSTPQPPHALPPTTTTTTTTVQSNEEELVFVDSEEEDAEAPEQMGFPSASGIWNEDAHMALLADALTYQSNYRKYLWHFGPLHPAGESACFSMCALLCLTIIPITLVLDDSNPTYFLSTAEGREEISSLSLGVNICLSRGTAIFLFIGKNNLFGFNRSIDNWPQECEHRVFQTRCATLGCSLDLIGGHEGLFGGDCSSGSRLASLVFM